MPFWRRYIVVDHEEYGLVWSFVLIDISKTHSNVIWLYFITKSKQPGHTFVSAVMCGGMHVNVYAYAVLRIQCVLNSHCIFARHCIHLRDF